MSGAEGRRFVADAVTPVLLAFFQFILAMVVAGNIVIRLCI
jgi:hypothetical protein